MLMLYERQNFSQTLSKQQSFRYHIISRTHEHCSWEMPYQFISYVISSDQTGGILEETVMWKRTNIMRLR